MPDPEPEIKQQMPLVSIGEIYRIKTKHALSLKPRKVTFRTKVNRSLGLANSVK
jgi:hypothetical protein